MLIRKSIIRKVFVYFALFAFLIGAIAFFFYIRGAEEVPYYVLIGSLFIFLLYFLMVYVYEIARPMKKILDEMRAMLTGNKYRRIYTSRFDEIGVMANFFNEVTKNFEKVSGDIKEGKRMTDELAIAAKLQRDILPASTPDIKGLDIVAKTRPAAELGGDSFDFIRTGDDVFIYVGDVTGHGVPAALVMTMVNTLIHAISELRDDAHDIVVGVNKQLKSRISATMFMTMLMLKWNENEQKMSYVGCGHEHLLVYRANSGKVEKIQTGGIALGMVPDNSKLVKELPIEIQKDDVIVLYSDGITEGRNMSGELYGLDRLVEAVERYAPEYDSAGISHHIAVDYSRFVQEHVQDDDVTLIVLKYNGGQKVEAKKDSTAWS